MTQELPTNAITLVFDSAGLKVEAISSAPVSQDTVITLNNVDSPVSTLTILSGNTATELSTATCDAASAPLVTISSVTPAIDTSGDVFEFGGTSFICCLESDEIFSVVSECCSNADAGNGTCDCIGSGGSVVGDPTINCCSGTEAGGLCD